MGKNAESFAILKAINYKDSSFESIQKHVDYILDKEKTPEKYRKAWYVEASDAVKGLERLYKRYHPKGTRNFKHWIVSYGVPHMDKDKAFEVSTKIAEYYAQDYPVILGLHTNIARRIHCHFLQNTVSVRSGRKFSQSNSDFDSFRKFVNQVLDRYDLPLLRGLDEEPKDVEMQPCDEKLIWSEDEFFSCEYQSPSFMTAVETNVIMETKIDIAQSLAVCKDGFKKFFEYGRGVRS